MKNSRIQKGKASNAMILAFFLFFNIVAGVSYSNVGNPHNSSAENSAKAADVHVITVSGDVFGTWDSDTVKVEGDITIPDSQTLTIEPGVYVEFQGWYKLNVQGTLLAIGTAIDSIIFTVNDTTGFSNMDITDGGWHGIRFDVTPTTNDSSKIMYCKLQFGKAVGDPPDRYGGALYLKRFSRLIIAHCLITKNCAYRGGAIACFEEWFVGSSPIVMNNKITHNRGANETYAFGGAIYCIGSHPTITNNKIMNNKAKYGGGIYLDTSNPMVTYNTISNNIATGSAGSDGGGINCNAYSNPIIKNNLITHNSAVTGGGFFSINYAQPTLKNNTISDNSADKGGGIGLKFESSPTMSQAACLSASRTALKREP